MYEDQLQKAVAQYLDHMGWLYCHVANERKTSPQRGYRLKQAGVKRGVPDVMIFEQWEVDQLATHNVYHNGFGVALELKSPKGRLTKEQADWLKALEQRGWFVAVCRTVQDVIDVCEVIRRES
jgi:hypothetical protein